MCGITGKITLTGSVRDFEIEAMNEAIRHRGPDDGGVYVSSKGNVGLGHRRLSIIDLSPLGKQPMSYLERYQIVFNGEIYNYQEQRKMLEKDGYAFRSKTDTEVILALYHKYREGCLKYLRGMFAFAIYDEKEEELFCARDRVGKKPFKYYWDGKTFIFASELKAILTQSEYQRQPDYLAIHHYLTYQYCPAPFTGFMGIKKLEPAHYLKLSTVSGQLTIKKYWNLNYNNKISLSEKEWTEKILAKLRESVKLRMIADVPLGAFLSGGIDSSTIVALMSEVSRNPVKTFSIGFKEQKFNELIYAKMVADKFHTEHTEFIVDPQAIELLPMLVRQYEEPYADSSALPTYYVSKLTREHVTVALNGDGGDENFAGYNRYAAIQFSAFCERFAGFNKIITGPMINLLTHLSSNSFFYRLKNFTDTLSFSTGARYADYVCHFDNKTKQNMYTADFASYIVGNDSASLVATLFEEDDVISPGERAMRVDFVTYLPDALLAKVDIASMAVALEGRSPFLDHEFLELTAQIPFNLKLHGLNGKKYILKKAIENIVPNELIYRKKMGFGIPIHDWLRKELKQYAYDLLLAKDAKINRIIKRSEIGKLLDEHATNKVNHGYRIWTLLTLELWFREYFNG